MTKNDNWCKGRILWKANQYKLFDDGCLEFVQLSITQKEFILDLIPKHKMPVIIFFSNIDRWTLFCTDVLLGYDAGELVEIDRNTMCQKFTPSIDKSNNKITNNQQKKDVRWLYAVESKKYIWFPSSNALSGSHSILNMLCRLKIEK